jgi:hypothetical protein
LCANFDNAQAAMNLQITKADTKSIIDGGTLTLNGRCYKAMSAGTSGRAHGNWHTTASASATCVDGRSQATPTTTPVEPVAPEPPPPTVASTSEVPSHQPLGATPAATAATQPPQRKSAAGGKAYTTGDSYSRLLPSGGSSTRIYSSSLAPPTTTLAEPIAPEPPPLTLAPASTVLHPRHPRLWHTPQRLRPVQFRVRP